MRGAGANADDGEQAAGARTFFPIAKKKIRVAAGAKSTGKDVARGEAGGEKLRAVGSDEIELDVFRGRLVAGRAHVEPLERIGLVAGASFVEVGIGVGELRGETGDEVGADVVAARADAGADGGEEVGRLGAKFVAETANGFFGDAGERAAPAGVDRGDSATASIHEEDGDAIGGLDAEEETRSGGEGGVALERGIERGREDAGERGMKLFERDEAEGIGADGGLKEAAILEDGLTSVPLHEAEIEDGFGVEVAGAAGASAEAMDEPGDAGERRKLEEAKTARTAKGPGSGEGESGFGRLTRAATGPGRFRGGWHLISILATGARQELGKREAASGRPRAEGAE